MKLRALGYLLICTIIFSGCVFFGSALLIQNQTSEADQFWRQYQDRSSAKAQAIDVLVTQLGYGGMIHQFKNYVLRKDKKRIQKIRNGGGAALSALDRYEGTGVSEKEKMAIADIKGVINKYLGNMDFVEGLANEGKDARGIDKVVKISDKPALEGINTLVGVIASERLTKGEQSTKTEILSQIRAALGYGGMIHQFKNYVLRQDQPRIAKVSKKANSALQAIKDFRVLGVNEEEDKALSAIAGVINEYTTNLKFVGNMSAKGSTPEHIDKKVKISDKPALQGLKTLVQEIAIQNNEGRRMLTTILQSVTGISMAIIVVALVSSLGLAGFAFWVVSSRIVSPISQMTQAMTALAGGDKSVEIEGAKRSDEIGAMANAVVVFKDNLIKMDQLTSERAAQEKHAREEKRRAMGKIADDFQTSVGSVVFTVSSSSTRMQSSAQTMSTISDETLKQATNVASASEEASTNVQTVASAAEELASSISEISRQVALSTEIASSAVVDSQKADKLIQGLVKSSGKIGEVLGLITDIADQTNLLALNATIEAARAGEAGKGFAVVASEVKNLANQTAKATEEISSQIIDIQGATKDSVQAIQGITKTISEMSEISSAIAAAVEEQGAATSEIARNVEQASAGTSKVSSNISDVTKASGEAGQSASEVLSSANELSQQSEILKSEVDKFLAQVRAV